MGPRRRRDEDGFTLIELMVVVLIIAVLLAIAVPSFLGARKRANDRAAQSNVRNANVAEMIVFTDKQAFTETVLDLMDVDTSLSYTQVLAAMSPKGNVVYVKLLPDTVQADDTVLLGAKSASGRCFWIRAVGSVNLLRFAENDCAGEPAVGDYKTDW